MAPERTAPPTDDRRATRRTRYPARYLWAVVDAIFTGLWTATRELDDRPAQRRRARTALLVAAGPMLVARARLATDHGTATDGTDAPTEPDDDASTVPDDDHSVETDIEPDGPAGRTPVPAVLVIGTALGVGTLVLSHRLETGMIRALRCRGFRRPAVVLGAVAAVLQLLVSAAELRPDPAAPPTERADPTDLVDPAR